MVIDYTRLRLSEYRREFAFSLSTDGTVSGEQSLLRLSRVVTEVDVIIVSSLDRRSRLFFMRQPINNHGEPRRGTGLRAIPNP